MSIISAFKKMYYSIYSGDSVDRDYKIALDRYFPDDGFKYSTPAYRDLEKKHDVSRTTCGKAIKQHFELKLKTKRKETDDLIDNFKTEIERVYSYIADFDNFVSLKYLTSFLNEKRSLSGIFELGDLCNASRNFHLVHLVGDEYYEKEWGYIISKDITREQLDRSFKEARKAAKYLGAVFPYGKLQLMPSWQYIPDKHKIRFAKELLSSGDGFMEFGDGDYFGFYKRDRLFSRLQKVYSVYDDVPDENLVNSLFRTIKKRLSKQAKISNGKIQDKDILEECADVFDEYYLRVGYCYANGSYIFASPNLKRSIDQVESFGDMYEEEVFLFNTIRENGDAMHSKEFRDLLDSIHTPNAKHFMEYADLFYSSSGRNSTYYTLDAFYETSKRRQYKINRISRNLRFARKVKRLCSYQCQVCGDGLEIGEYEFYAEAHHVQPLGMPHNGPDKLENMMCVCPNCHIKLDYGAVYLDKENLHFLNQNGIADVYISYHNQKIYSRKESS